MAARNVRYAPWRYCTRRTASSRTSGWVQWTLAVENVFLAEWFNASGSRGIVMKW